MDKGNDVSYSDFLQDALDHKLVNTAFIEDEDNGMIFLISTKFIKAYSQLLINFGKNSWIVKFSNYECSLANSAYNAMMKKAMSIYSIKKNEIIKAMTDFKTSEIIQNYISSHMTWENSVNHSHMTNVLVNKTASCYINSMLQCLARIPALTQLLLDTDLFQNMDKSSFLHKYITLLNLITEDKKSEAIIKNAIILFLIIDLN